MSKTNRTTNGRSAAEPQPKRILTQSRKAAKKSKIIEGKIIQTRFEQVF